MRPLTNMRSPEIPWSEYSVEHNSSPGVCWPPCAVIIVWKPQNLIHRLSPLCGRVGCEHTGYIVYFQCFLLGSLVRVGLCLAFGFIWGYVYFFLTIQDVYSHPVWFFPQLHLHLNLVGSLPWVGHIPCPTPHNLQCVRACTHLGTLLFLWVAARFVVCVSGGRIEWVIILGMETQEIFFE